MTAKIDIDQNWLRGEYLDKHRSTTDLGNEIGCSHVTIWSRLQEIGAVRKKPRKNMDLNWICEQYISEGKSAPDIAEEIGVSETTIRRKLKKIGIMRTQIESKQTKKFRKKISKGNKGKKRSIHFKQNVSKVSSIRWQDEQFRQKMSAMRQGVPFDEWKDYVSFEPYCPKFNFGLKERIRNGDDRRCQLCGKSEILNKRRLAVHHIDYDKMQGCDEKPFFLTSLCSSCSTKANFNRKMHEFLIASNHQWTYKNRS